MQVECEVNYYEDETPARVEVTCSKCGHTVESFGTSDASVRRCLALLREECPLGENNFYVDEDDGF